ncbi:MAG: sigma-70 family RNA polymerase sigma factor [Phycisphaerae bacterium]
MPRKHADIDDAPTPKSLLLRLRCGRGEKSDWEQFCGIYAPMAFRLARKWGLEMHDSQDVAAAVMRSLFVRMTRGFVRKGRRGAFRGYIATVTRRAVRDIRRQAARHRSGGDGALRSGGGTPSTDLRDLKANTPGEMLERMETIDRLRYCLAHLKSSRAVRQRTWEVFEAFALGGESAASVARGFGVKPEHVYVIKNEMLVRIRNMMAGLEADFTETP